LSESVAEIGLFSAVAIKARQANKKAVGWRTIGPADGKLVAAGSRYWRVSQ
jgi:hypothetical protein